MTTSNDVNTKIVGSRLYWVSPLPCLSSTQSLSEPPLSTPLPPHALIVTNTRALSLPADL